MLEYKKIFLDEMKLLLLDLIKFFEDNFIVSKEYPNNYIVIRLNNNQLSRLYIIKVHFMQIMIIKKYILLIVKMFCNKKGEK